MKKLTRDYRMAELENISATHPIYKAQIQLVDNHGRTKWLSISDKELQAIKKILVAQKGE